MARRRGTRGGGGGGGGDGGGGRGGGARGGGGPLGFSGGQVGFAQRDLVHRPARRHADLPVAEPSGPVLHGRQRAGLQNVDARLWIGQPVKRRGRVRGRAHIG